MLNCLTDKEYFHLPNVQMFDGLLDLISGCTLAILANVLDFRTYSAPHQGEEASMTPVQQRLWKEFDRNDIPGDERRAMCYARGIALNVFHWIRTYCIVKTPDGQIIDDLPSKHVVNLLDALLVYKSKADKRSLKGAPHYTLPKLKVQVLNVIKSDSLVEKLWKERPGEPSSNLRLTLDKGCTVGWKDDMPIRTAIHRKYSIVFYI